MCVKQFNVNERPAFILHLSFVCKSCLIINSVPEGCKVAFIALIETLISMLRFLLVNSAILV